jgi:hypothetical protein
LRLGRQTAIQAYPNYWVAFPWPESDRLESHFGPKTSVLITIAKVQFWDTGSACFNPPVEGGSGGGSPVLQISPAGDRRRIEVFNGEPTFSILIGACLAKEIVNACVVHAS